MSSTTKRMDAKQLIDFSVDYYEILDLVRDNVPNGSTPAERRVLSDILDRAYQGACRRYHPDYNPHLSNAEELFRLAIRAHTILSDPIARRYYDSGGKDKSRTIEIDGKRYEINWDDLGFYRPGTTADSVGFGLFVALSERKNELGITPAFYPELPQHNYEWDFAVPDMNVKLAISLVPDEDDVRRLTTGGDIGHSLPFKIYICFPRACPYFFKDKDEVHQVGDRTIIMSGRIQKAMYVDYDLLETTTLHTAQEFVSGDKVKEALRDLRDGSLQKRQQEKDKEAGVLNWLDTKTMKEVEAERLRAILRRKTPQVKYDPYASDFLKRVGQQQVDTSEES